MFLRTQSNKISRSSWERRSRVLQKQENGNQRGKFYKREDGFSLEVGNEGSCRWWFRSKRTLPKKVGTQLVCLIPRAHQEPGSVGSWLVVLCYSGCRGRWRWDRKSRSLELFLEKSSKERDFEVRLEPPCSCHSIVPYVRTGSFGFSILKNKCINHFALVAFLDGSMRREGCLAP